MRSKQSLPLLLAAANQLNLSPADRHHIARALGRLGVDRAAGVLAGWLRDNDYQLKELALTSLETLDSEAAAREARPLLKSEPHLPFKLRLARLLARHGLADGYALATEHLADAAHTAGASLVLAALDDPRTTNDLSAIVAAQPDRRWLAAALTGLAAIGDAAARRQLLDILGDDRHPLASGAAEAAGLSADGELLLPLAALVRSRNKQIALASLVALRRFLSDVRSSPRGLAAVNLTAADLDNADLGGAELAAGELLAPAADVPPTFRRRRAPRSPRRSPRSWSMPTSSPTCATRRSPSRGCCAASRTPRCCRTWPTRPSWKARRCWRRCKPNGAGQRSLPTSYHLDDDFSFGASRFDVSHRLVGRFERKYLVDDRTNDPGIDKSGDLAQLGAVRFHEEE
jgi:hypothetical protein